MELVVPSEQYKESFIKAIEEFHAVESVEGRVVYDLKIEDLLSNFSSYISKLLLNAEGKDLPEGFVPQTTYWLVDNNEFIGTLHIRHTLNDHLLKEGGNIGYDIRPSKRRLGYGNKILELALSKAKEIGLTKALITCDETNIGSKKIIEGNGGIIENRIELKKGKPFKLRYWIDLQ